jgi:hypothetical protein
MELATRNARPIDSPLQRHRALLRITIGVSIAVAVVVILWRWPLAWTVVVLAAILFCMDVLIWLIDQRALREKRLPPMSGEVRDRIVHAAVERVALRTALVIAGGLASIAIVLALIAFGWPIIAIGALGIFAWLALLGFPFWLATIGEEAETEHDQLTGESRSIH